MPWTYVISDINGEEIAGTFCKKEFQKINQIEFSIEKVRKTIYKQYIKWKGYDSSFNCWVDKKDTLI